MPGSSQSEGWEHLLVHISKVWRDEDVNSENSSSTVGGDGGECFKNRDRGSEKEGSNPGQPLLADAFTPGASSVLP